MNPASRPIAAEDLEPIEDEYPHDHKGYSEEKCVCCGWVMGHAPLNCNNDDTPHRFPSMFEYLQTDEASAYPLRLLTRVGDETFIEMLATLDTVLARSAELETKVEQVLSQVSDDRTVADPNLQAEFGHGYLSVYPAAPDPPRSLRNEIAHALMEGHDWSVTEMRRALEAAQIAVDTCGAFVLVNGPDVLLDELGA